MRNLTLMLKSLTHMFLVILLVPPVPVPFTENMNCVRSVLMKLAYVKLNRVPLLKFFSATGGMANELKMKQPCFTNVLLPCYQINGTQIIYAAVMGWIRCCLSFSLLRSAIRCLRGSRSSKGSFGHSLGSAPIDLIQVESRLPSIKQ